MNRFWNKVQKGDACWEWLANRNRDGYGTFWFESRYQKAHRVAYQLLVGEIPAGLQLDHLCRNRGCVNPDHLEPVSGRENVLRGVTVAARNTHKTHCPQGHEYSEGNTYVWGRKRHCRTCNRLSHQKA